MVARGRADRSMNIYFARHGESEANLLRVFSNRGLGHPLTETGVAQAEALASSLAGVSFARVYASPLLRARQTADIVARQLSAGSVIVAEALREYDVGVLEGRADDLAWCEYFQVADRWRDARNRDERIDGGESYAEIQARFHRFALGLVGEGAMDGANPSRDGNLLCVTHGGLLRVGLPAILDDFDYGLMMDNPLGNCRVIVVDSRDIRPKTDA